MCCLFNINSLCDAFFRRELSHLHQFPGNLAGSIGRKASIMSSQPIEIIGRKPFVEGTVYLTLDDIYVIMFHKQQSPSERGFADPGPAGRLEPVPA